MRNDYELDLENAVRSVVNSFMDYDTLFTALDVSNEVKKTMPTATHRDVRNEVRRLFAEIIEPAGWSRNEIDVTLEDGSTRTALLYHPLSASWSLDELYDQQKRSQVSVKSSSQALCDLASDKDYSVDSTVDRGNIVQTTVFPPNNHVVDTTVPTPTVNDVEPVLLPPTDVLDSFAEEYRALTDKLYKSLGFSGEPEAKALVEAAKVKASDTFGRAVNLLSSFLPKK